MEQLRKKVGDEALVIRSNREDGGKNLKNVICLNIKDETSNKGLCNCIEILDLGHYSHFYIKLICKWRNQTKNVAKKGWVRACRAVVIKTTV
jgi:hypothetical protein